MYTIIESLIVSIAETHGCVFIDTALTYENGVTEYTESQYPLLLTGINSDPSLDK